MGQPPPFYLAKCTLYAQHDPGQCLLSRIQRLMSVATSILPNFNTFLHAMAGHKYFGSGCHTLIFPHIKSKWPATIQPLANNSCCRHFTPLRGWPIRFLHRRQPATAFLAQYWPFGLMICCMTPWAISNLFRPSFRAYYRVITAKNRYLNYGMISY